MPPSVIDYADSTSPARGEVRNGPIRYDKPGKQRLRRINYADDQPTVVAPQGDFVLRVNTNRGGNGATETDTFTIPIVNARDYDCQVNWGDNVIEQIVKPAGQNLTAFTHVYPAPGEYDIYITGEFPGFALNGGNNDRNKLLRLEILNPDFKFSVGGAGLRGASYLQECINFELATNAKNIALFFHTCTRMTRLTLKGNRLAHATSWQQFCFRTDAMPVCPNFDTVNSTNMATAFRQSGITFLPALPFDSCNRFTSTWYQCSELVEVEAGITFPEFRFGQNMFRDCTKLTTFPANAFDDIKAGDFNNAFTGCALTEQSVNNILISIDVSGVASGDLDMNGGTNAAPTGAGADAADNLRAKGWTVITN